jgi:hypothetical protein
MEQTPKHVKRALRELAAAAHEEELRRVLVPLQAAFDRWARREMSSGELTDHIHRFHQGPAQELSARYSASMLDAAVAYAIVAGFIERSDVPAAVLSHLARALAFYESQREAS